MFVHIDNPYTIQNIKLWCKLNNKPFELISDIYKGNDKKLKWKCLKEECQEIFKMSWDSIFSQNSICPYCTGQKVGLSNCLATKNPELAKEWHPTKNGDLTPYDVTCGSGKETWWLCKNDHEWQAKILSRTNLKTNCPYCSGFYPSKDYNLLLVNPKLCKEWNYKKNSKPSSEYTPNCHEKVWWKCKECSHEWKASIAHRNNNRGCPQCNESKGEKFVSFVLENNREVFDPQYTFSDLLSDLGNPLRFDFVVFYDKEKTKIKLLIEYDGEGHFSERPFGKKSYETTVKHDQLKNNYCQQHNMPLLRIPYWEYNNIESILNNYLIKE